VGCGDAVHGLAAPYGAPGERRAHRSARIAKSASWALFAAFRSSSSGRRDKSPVPLTETGLLPFEPTGVQPGAEKRVPEHYSAKFRSIFRGIAQPLWASQRSRGPGFVAQARRAIRRPRMAFGPRRDRAEPFVMSAQDQAHAIVLRNAATSFAMQHSCHAQAALSLTPLRCAHE
jgi:hypothetical protein